MTSALGLGGVGIAAILAVAILMLVRRVDLGALIDAGKAQVAAERNLAAAEAQRDSVHADAVRLDAQCSEYAAKISNLNARLAAANAALTKLKTKEIEHAPDVDLVALSHGVLGAVVPAAGGSGDADAAGGHDQAAAVHGPPGASER